MGLAQPVPRLSAAEYLRLERQAEWKSEFFEGEVFAMAGASEEHNIIVLNVAGELRRLLKNRGCQVYANDMRVKTEASGLYTYPDVVVACGERKFEDSARDTLLNPLVIFEVLSDSTEAYDRGRKFDNYQQIPSLREYLLVSQHEARIVHHVRQAQGEWLLRQAVGLKAKLALPTLEISLALSKVFAEVEFKPEPLRAATPPRNT